MTSTLILSRFLTRSDAKECLWAMKALKLRLLCSSPLDHTHERLLKWKRGNTDNGHSLFCVTLSTLLSALYENDKVYVGHSGTHF